MPLYLLQQCVEKRKSSRLVGGQGEHGKRHSLSLPCFMKKENRGGGRLTSRNQTPTQTNTTPTTQAQNTLP